MADLYHLLDEIDEPQEQPVDEEQVDEDELRSPEREHLEVPPALAQAEQRKREGTPDALEEERVDLEDVAATEQSLLSIPYQKLQNLWTQELQSPELLPFDEETIVGLTEAVRQREEGLEESEMNTGNANMDALIESILKIDMDRVKFLLSDLLRMRLQKIEEHPLYMRELVDRMSENEVAYLKEYGALLEAHLRRTVLDHFPQDVWKKLDAPEMIDEPDLNTYVFIKTKDNVAIDNGTPENPDLQQHDQGTCLIVRYNRVRELFLDGKIELLM